MKNLAKIFMAVVLLAGITSCVQDTTVDGGIFQPTTELTISVADANRTALGAKTDEGTYPVYWSNGDKVSVNGISSAALAVAEDATEQVKGVFEFKGDLGATPYKASYPATAEAGKVLFAAKQSYKEGSFSEGAAAMYGESETMAIEMKHAAGVLQFPIKAAEGEDVVLKKVIVTNVNGKLAGLYTAELIEGELALTPDATATSSISYDCGELALSTEPVKLHIAVPAGEYAELKVSLVSAAHGIMNFKVSATGEKTIKPGIVREFNETTGILFSGNDATFQISDSESLMEFAKLCNEGGFAYSGAEVTANITFDDDTYDWVSVSNFTEGFTFDGGNHTITGLTDALFTKANGTIRNLTLDSTINDTNASGLSFYGIFADQFAGTISDCTAKGSISIKGATSNWSAVGGFVGVIFDSCVFTNVTNEANISITTKDRIYGSGIVGSTYRNAAPAEGTTLTFTNCHNNGEITSEESVGLAASTNEGRRGLGGLLGCNYQTAGATFTSCSNTGDITNKTIIDDLHMGGIIGSDMAPATLTTVTNSGAITCGGEQYKTGNNYSIGGLVGYQTNTLSATDCTNLAGGIVSVGNAPGGVKIGGIVGFASSGDESTYLRCNNYATMSAKSSYKNLWVAGVIAHNSTANSTMTDCHNYGQIDIEGATGTGEFDVAGVVAQSGNTTLYNLSNEIEKITCNATAGTIWRVGGVIAKVTGEKPIEKLTNKAIIDFQGALTTGYDNGDSNRQKYASVIGGVIGMLGAYSSTSVSTAKDIFNTKKIELNPDNFKSDYIFVGGCIGQAVQYSVDNADMTGESINYNEGKLFNQYSGANGDFRIGGIIGEVETVTASTATIENCDNSASISLRNGKQIYHNCYFGGIIAGVRKAVAISNCTNSGDWTSGANILGGNKSMGVGGIVGSLATSSSITGCTNSGDFLFETKTTSNTVANNMWYSADAGGIAGYIGGANTISGCTNTGSITAQKLSLGNTKLARRSTFGGIVAYAKVADLVECTNNGNITVDPDCGAWNGSDGQSLRVGGLVGTCDTKSTSTYLIKDCTQDSNISVGGPWVNVGCAIGNTYDKVASLYTPTDATTEFPVIGCKFDGSFNEISDITNENFHQVIYAGAQPSVDTWVPVVGEDGITRYHGNYGVKTEGGESGDDL